MSFNPSYIGARNDMASLITGKDLNVLDIGCSNGSNGVFLKNAGIAAHVTGVEFDEMMSKEAAKSLDNVIEGDIADHNVVKKIPDLFYDYILFGDILEHLEDPWLVLSTLNSKLKDGGKIIISIPNSGHIDVAFHLLFKKTWPVNERGIFDKTHRRFFARNDIEKLVSEKGVFRILKINRNFRYRDAMYSQFPLFGKLLKYLFPDWFTFQFLIVAEKVVNLSNKKLL